MDKDPKFIKDLEKQNRNSTLWLVGLVFLSAAALAAPTLIELFVHKKATGE